MSTKRALLFLPSLLLALLLGPACSCGVEPPGPDENDAGAPDAGQDDAGPGDAGESDAGPGDAGESDAGPGDAGQDDAGQDNAGPGDAGQDDAGQDAGPNTAPQIIGITVPADPVEDPGSLNVTVDASDPENDPLTYTFAVTDANGQPVAGAFIDPAGATPYNNAIIYLSGSVPRGTYTVTVEVSDGELTTQGTAQFTVRNHAPTLALVEGVRVLPEDPAVSTTIATADDVDLLSIDDADALTLQAAIVGGPIDGVTVSVTNAAPYVVKFAVDRSTYQPPINQIGQQVSVQVTVTDDQGDEATGTVAVFIEDERGGHVDNSSPYDGNCGSVAHPCNNFADAIASLESLRAVDPSVENELRVATTNTVYTLDAALVLEGGLDLLCGFDAANLDAYGQWQQTADRTPLRFTSANGVRVSNEFGPPELSSRIERCDIELLDEQTPSAERAGVLVDGGHAEITESRIAGHLGTAASTFVAAVVVKGEAVNPQPVFIENSELVGGNALTGQESYAVGLWAQGREVFAARNVMRGGTAKIVAGAAVKDAPSTLQENNLIGGKGELLAVGVVVERGAHGTVLTNNDIVGTDVSSEQGAIGALLHAATTLNDNTIQSGNAANGTGLLADGQPDGAPSPTPFSFTSTNDEIRGDGTNPFGVLLSKSVTGNLINARIEAFGSPASPASKTIGVYVDVVSSATLIDSEVKTDDAESSTAGVLVGSNASSMKLQGTTVSAGNAGNANNDFSIGVSAGGGTVVLKDSDVTSGSGTYSFAVFVQNARLSAANLSASAGSATANSSGVYLSNPTPGILLQNVTATGGTATGATTAASYGLYGLASGQPGELIRLSITGGSYAGGIADYRSVGIWLDAPVLISTLDGVTASGGEGGSSAGLVLRQGASGVGVHGSTLVGGTARGDASFPGEGESVSAGLWTDGPVDGSTFERNLMEGGVVEVNPGRSVGLRMRVDGPLAVNTYVINNVIRGGKGPSASALEVQGSAENTLRILHNNLFGGGKEGGESAAVRMAPPLNAPAGRYRVAIFGGNIVDPGVGDTRIGFFETCVPRGAVGAAIGLPERAVNSNFWPNVSKDSGVIYVRRHDASCNATDLTSINDVNGGSFILPNPYREVSNPFCTSKSYDEDPEFIDGESLSGIERNGVHISETSFLRDKAAHTLGCDLSDGPLWPSANGTLRDYDIQARPNGGSNPDIGADEVP